MKPLIVNILKEKWSRGYRYMLMIRVHLFTTIFPVWEFEWLHCNSGNIFLMMALSGDSSALGSPLSRGEFLWRVLLISVKIMYIHSLRTLRTVEVLQSPFPNSLFYIWFLSLIFLQKPFLSMLFKVLHIKPYYFKNKCDITNNDIIIL